MRMPRLFWAIILTPVFRCFEIVLRAGLFVVYALVAWSIFWALNRAMGFPWPWRYLF